MVFDIVAEHAIPTAENLAEAVHHWLEVCNRLDALPMSDADRAGEGLWVVASSQRLQHTPVPARRWQFQIVGRETSDVYGALELTAAGETTVEAPLEVLGLALMIALNGSEHVERAELEALMQLADALNHHYESQDGGHSLAA